MSLQVFSKKDGKKLQQKKPQPFRAEALANLQKKSIPLKFVIFFVLLRF